jgi:hypothetical protein
MLKSMQVFLKKHAPDSAYHSLKVEWTRDNRNLVIRFNVQKRDSSKWQANPNMTDDWTKNWGLWNTDVVEAFLQLRENENDLKAPYLEIQVSPLNQPFALVIAEPRKTFFLPEKLNFTSESVVEGRNWKAQLTIELPHEIKGELLYGGFFSCLGLNEGKREFYALNPNPEANPDFHRPQLFVNLDLT